MGSKIFPNESVPSSSDLDTTMEHYDAPTSHQLAMEVKARIRNELEGKTQPTIPEHLLVMPKVRKVHTMGELVKNVTKTRRNAPSQRDYEREAAIVQTPHRSFEEVEGLAQSEGKKLFGLTGGIDSKDNEFRPVLDGKSLFIFSKINPIRLVCYRFIYHKAIEFFILMCIVFNVVTLSLDDFPEEAQSEAKRDFIVTTDYVMTAVFTTEAVMRIITLGFILGKHTYLKSWWNVLDFAVVISSLMDLLPGVNVNLTFLRAMRALRPLRAMKYLSGLRAIWESLIKSIPLISDVLFLMTFFFLMYGILGVQFFKDSLESKCLIDDLYAEDPINWNNAEPFPASFCDSTVENTCGVGQTCVDLDDAFNEGFTSFRNIGFSILTIFTCVSLEGWSPVYYSTLDTWDVLPSIFFVSLILFMSFLVLNLFVAVISASFAHTREQNVSGSAFEKKKKRRRGFRVGAQRASEFTKQLWVSVGSPLRNFRLQLPKPLEDGKDAIHNWCEKIVHSQSFEVAILGCIIINTVFLAMEHSDMEDWYILMLSVAEYTFTGIFALEMVLKVIGEGGFFSYLKKGVNRFDFVIVVTSLVDLGLTASGGSGTGNLSLLRIFRLLRIARLVRFSRELKQLLATVVGSFNNILNLLAFLFFFILVFGILAMQLFGGTLDGRINFNTFPEAALALFQVLTGENWIDILYLAMANGNPKASPAFFITFFMLGNFILLNLFVAVILENFTIAEEEKEHMQMKKFSPDEADAGPGKLAVMFRWLIGLYSYIKDGICHKLGRSPPPRADKVVPAPLEEGTVVGGLSKDVDGSPSLTSPDSPTEGVGIQPLPQQQQRRSSTDTGETPTMQVVRDVSGLTRVKMLSRYRPDSNAVCCIPATSAVRTHCKDIVRNKWFERLIILAIVASTVTMAMEDPTTRKNESIMSVIESLDLFFLVLFTVEFMLKVLASGFIFAEGAYLRDSWNRLDFVILIFTYVNAFFSFGRSLRSLRLGRALRPLRMMSRNEGMKVIINSLMRSIPSVMNAVVLTLACFLVFAILGLNLFSGKFAYCNDSAVGFEVECVGTYINDVGVSAPRVWGNPTYHFDHIGAAFMTLFEVASLEGWVKVMHSGMDVTGDGIQPSRNASAANAFYFIVFIVVGSFFVVKLFVGVIIDHFQQYQGTAFLTSKQKNWKKMREYMLRIRPEKASTRPKNFLRAKCYDIVNLKQFEIATAFVILLNVVVMTLSFRNEPESWSSALEIVNYVFIGLYTIEAALKLSGLGIRAYFSDSWNQFDFLILVGSIVMITITKALNLEDIGVASVARAFRMARVIRLLKHAKGLRTIFNTLIISMPSILNVTFLLALVYTIFALLGVQLFGHTKHQEFLTTDANFGTFLNAMILLLRMSTGEDWNGIMHDCRVQPPLCKAASEDDDGDCGSSFATLFFVAFYIATAWIFLNLFIAIILENFGEIADMESSIIKEDHIDEFRKIWVELDVEANGYLPVDRLKSLLQKLSKRPDNPLGFEPDASPYNRIQFRTICLEAEYVCRGDPRGVSMQQVMYILSLNTMGMDALHYQDRSKEEAQKREHEKQAAAQTIAKSVSYFLERAALRQKIRLERERLSTARTLSSNPSFSPRSPTSARSGKSIGQKFKNFFQRSPRSSPNLEPPESPGRSPRSGIFHSPRSRRHRAAMEPEPNDSLHTIPRLISPIGGQELPDEDDSEVSQLPPIRSPPCQIPSDSEGEHSSGESDDALFKAQCSRPRDDGAK